jgi:hypothetical protein
MDAAGTILAAIFRHAADKSGLSEGQFEVKSFTIIAARNRPGSRRKIADSDRKAAEPDPVKNLEKTAPGNGFGAVVRATAGNTENEKWS